VSDPLPPTSSVVERPAEVPSPAPVVAERVADEIAAPARPADNAIAGATHEPARPTEPDPVEAGRVTSSQLRRFIRSRPYVPLHELRRRFALNGSADDMAALDVDGQRMWVGLPEREGRLLAELLRGGDIGYELSVDPVTPVIVGVYPLRTVHRA
jgi:hypothetical protein